MKKVLCGIVFFVLVAGILTGCQNDDLKTQISQEIGVNVQNGTQVHDYDTHSGNGDGTTCAIIAFTDDSVANEIAENDAWKKLPLDQTLTTLVYGIADKNTKDGPYVVDNDGNALVPQIKNGYYRFIDRHADSSDPADDTEVLNRKSYNFTLAIYDTDANNLYFIKLDT